MPPKHDGSNGAPTSHRTRCQSMTDRNRTDYQFPDGWGLMADAQKARWYTRERVRRRARRQSRESDVVGDRSPGDD
jgi:hypothetical protein